MKELCKHIAVKCVSAVSSKREIKRAQSIYVRIGWTVEFSLIIVAIYKIQPIFKCKSFKNEQNLGTVKLQDLTVVMLYPKSRCIVFYDLHLERR